MALCLVKPSAQSVCILGQPVLHAGPGPHGTALLRPAVTAACFLIAVYASGAFKVGGCISSFLFHASHMLLANPALL